MFQITLGSYVGPRNKISKEFSDQTVYNCQANKALDVRNPIVDIATKDDLSMLNYAYIPSLHRYYFVCDRVLQVNGIWSLSLTVDLLKTYETQLQTTKCMFRRSSDFFNTYLPDEIAPLTNRQVISNHIFPSSPFDNEIGTHGVIVTLAGSNYTGGE